MSNLPSFWRSDNSKEGLFRVECSNSSVTARGTEKLSLGIQLRIMRLHRHEWENRVPAGTKRAHKRSDLGECPDLTEPWELGGLLTNRGSEALSIPSVSGQRPR